ncbi:MAG: aminopeptidase P family protein [Candidatus Gracilibacteria bacterium]|nr:aminopeptidase P family protein [Candidatus Gracilibacteria bacterium]
MQIQKKLSRQLAKKNLKAFLVTSPANVHYLTGHDFGGDAFCLLFQNKIYVLTDRRYENVKLSACELVIVRKKLALELKNILGKIKKLAVEDSFTLRQVKKLGNYKLIAKVGLIEELRMLKSTDEIKEITKACQLTKEAFRMIEKKLKGGMTERQIAWEMEKFVRERGADALAFTPIVASGENGAKAHAVLTDRKLKEGDLVTIDFGVKVAGYHSDMTRTYQIGKISKKQAEILSLVKRAQKEALKIIKPGIELSKIDQVARKVIEQPGYAKFFSHATGHGMGLEIHEEPRISLKSRGKVQAGMVFTIEPGIYLPDCGVRWEDTVLVRKKGYKKLTS